MAIINGTVNDDVLNGTTDADEISGLEGNDTIDGGEGADTLRGGLGDDTYIVGAGDTVVEKSNQGIDDIETLLAAYTLGNYLENLTFTGAGAFEGVGNSLANVILGGAGADDLVGNSGNDTLVGAGGDDELNGGRGSDLMQGGTGNDIYVVDSAGDVVDETGGSGTDLVRTTASHTLSAGVENMLMQGTGTLTGTGNDLANTMTGNTVNNRLFGLAGIDTLTGGSGDDTLDGGDEGDTLNGGADNDTLLGGAGNDTLDGGTGDDDMRGGAGDDSYFVDSAGDTASETGGSGIDTVRSSVTFTLAAGIENLIITTSAAVNGTGNTGNNTLTGGSGANVLSGMAGDDTIIANSGNDTLDGGTGADNMQGGSGNDTYIVDNVGDVADETGGGGSADVVQASASFTLGAGVEQLVLTGTMFINGTGNDLNNIITGNSGNNVIAGGIGNDTLSGGAGNDTLDGGAGNDTMAGGLGNDIYVVDSGSDSISEAAGEGTDTVRSELSAFTLAAEFENLEFLYAFGGVGTGNAADNVITGNNGNDYLVGQGGRDTVNGGNGDDLLNVDLAADYVSGEVYNGGAGNDLFQYAVFGGTLDLGLATFTSIERLSSSAAETQSTAARLAAFTSEISAYDYRLTSAGSVVLASQAGVYLGNLYLSNLGNTVDVSALTFYSIAAIRGGNGTDIITGGTNSEYLYGGAGNDTIAGNAGADAITGGLGKDTMTGGAGDDIFYVDTAGEIVSGESYDGGADIDQIVFVGSDLLANFTATTITSVERFYSNAAENRFTAAQLAGFTDQVSAYDVRLTTGGTVDLTTASYFAVNQLFLADAGNTVNLSGLTNYSFSSIEGGAGADTVTSSIYADYLLGFGGNDTLNGLGGNDSLDGGEGNDTLNGGNDADNLTGGGGADTINGEAGDDIAYVSAGTDLVAGETVNGGAGSDELSISIADPVISLAGTTLNSIERLYSNVAETRMSTATFAGFTDRLQAYDIRLLDGGTATLSTQSYLGIGTLYLADAGNTINYSTLSGYAITVQGGAAADTVMGGGNNDAIYGNGGDDILSSGAVGDALYGGAGNDSLNGGAGTDYMSGGDGDDTYFVDNTGDNVDDQGDGTDLVNTTVGYTLPDPIENLTLLGTGGISGFGNGQNNLIIGNSGANSLYGLEGNDILDGGTGNDTLRGGNGDDIYILDNAGDVVNEAGASGIDTVRVNFATYTLGSVFENLEFLTAADATGTGNALANRITGNAGADNLSGLGGNDTLTGGAGNDTMDGGAGSDVFVFAAGSGADTINFFGNGEDLLDVSAFGYHNFTEFTNGGGSIVADGLDTVVTFNGAGDNVRLTLIPVANINHEDMLFAV